MSFCDLQMIEHRERISIEMLVSVDLGGSRHIRRRVAARGIADAAVAAREVTHLRLPIGVVGGEFVQEDDGCSAPRLLEIEPDIVARYGVGHLTFLLSFLFGRVFFTRTGNPPRIKSGAGLRLKTLSRPSPKIAVNARGC